MPTTRLRSIAILPVIVLASATAGGGPPAAPNGIALPDGYRDWRLLAPSYRGDKHHVRAILGNDIAINAARANKTRPWPDGAILAKLSWKEKVHGHFPTALVPGEFVQAEFMVKDAKKYAATGGWGFARWLGAEQRPYGKNANFAAECFGCHTPVKDSDYVFTQPVVLP